VSALLSSSAESRSRSFSGISLARNETFRGPRLIYRQDDQDQRPPQESEICGRLTLWRLHPRSKTLPDRCIAWNARRGRYHPPYHVSPISGVRLDYWCIMGCRMVSRRPSRSPSKPGRRSNLRSWRRVDKKQRIGTDVSMKG
jgi:hypothetical protein